MEEENLGGILTFDELLEDDYYKSEFEKRVQERIKKENSHSDVKGGEETMDDNVQIIEGETLSDMPEQSASQPTDEGNTDYADNPAAEPTVKVEPDEAKNEQGEPAREMTAQQFEHYNETLRRVSKTAKGSLPVRYNAFEDAEVKNLVKRQILAGELPNVKAIAADVVARISATAEPNPDKEKTHNADAEMLNLKAENALLKAGVLPERIDAAKKLFIAEGGDLGKVSEFVAKYPEWHKKEQGVVFSKAAPVVGKTAPNPTSRQALNDFEKKVAEARKKAGLE